MPDSGSLGVELGRLGFHVLNLGCKVNRVESDTIAAACMDAGAVAVAHEQAAVAVVNTCTVTAEADTKTRKAVRRLARECNCPVIVTGCAAAINPEHLKQLGERVVVEPSKLKAAQLAVEVLRRAKVDFTVAEGAAECAAEDAAVEESLATAKGGAKAALDEAAPMREVLLPSSTRAIELRATDGFKTRMDIKIQDGCNNACTYCIVHTARGPVRCVQLESVVQQVASAAHAGVGEVVLSGVNLGCYNSDGARLPQLLEVLLQQTAIGRVRISSIEPQHVDEQLASVMARYQNRLCAHLHIPLQSGCDKTLQAMGRLYTTAEFAHRVQLVRSAVPQLALSTDVIVGFPQESDADFEQSLEFCRAMGFSKMHVFRYSRRPGTPAATMEGQVQPQIMAQRAEQMRQLSKQMGLADAQLRVASTEQVLMMSEQLGMSESYHDVYLQQPQTKGTLISARITGVADDGSLLAAPCVEC